MHIFKKIYILFFIFFTLVSTINFNTLSNNFNDKNINSLKQHKQPTNKENNELAINLSNFLNFIEEKLSEIILPLHLKLNKKIATLETIQSIYVTEGLLLTSLMGILGNRHQVLASITAAITSYIYSPLLHPDLNYNYTQV